MQEASTLTNASGRLMTQSLLNKGTEIILDSKEKMKLLCCSIKRGSSVCGLLKKRFKKRFAVFRSPA